MSEQERQKMREMIKKTVDMNRVLLEELDSMIVENSQLEEENKKWREYFENGSQLYRKNQPNRARQ